MLTGDEEFLKDHFSGFPVMPGVLLLEALKQASGRLLDSRSDYRLVWAENVKFGQFVKPGSRLRIQSKFLKTEDSLHIFDGRIDLMNAAGDAPQGKALTASLALKVSGKK
jgi:3-hydroxyacyl-[acyl-carrier-protein] dehydratase